MENEMTVFEEQRALAEKWREECREDENVALGLIVPEDLYLWRAADELTELLDKVVVTDEMVLRALNAYYRETGWDTSSLYADGAKETIKDMRAALESALGVTK
jgi:hypothetical protein